MNILFICGSAQPGKDGVGDYTRRLCGKLIRTGHEAQIVSLYDHQAIAFQCENQTVEETTVVVHRIPVRTSKKQRIIWAQELVKQIKPDWISLQFVPYSFNRKGLPLWLPSFLKKIKGNHKLHIMFHELWLGMDKESSLKNKCIGRLQQILISKIIHNTEVHFVSTQNKLYQFFLHSHNITAEILPICGNIPVKTVKKEETEFIQFVLFGTIHIGAPFADFVNDLRSESNMFDKPLKFVFIGKNGPELIKYTTILDNYNISYVILGSQPENVVSKVLSNSFLGISTTPYFQTEKSGVYAAYREHKLNAICVARNWMPTKGQYNIPQIIKYEKNNLNLIFGDIETFDLELMAKQFINSISKL